MYTEMLDLDKEDKSNTRVVKAEIELKQMMEVVKEKEKDLADKEEQITDLLHNIKITSSRNAEYEEKLIGVSQVVFEKKN